MFAEGGGDGSDGSESADDEDADSSRGGRGKGNHAAASRRRKSSSVKGRKSKPSVRELRAKVGPILFKRRLLELKAQGIDFTASFAVPSTCPVSGKPLAECTCANHDLKSVRQTIAKGNRKKAQPEIREHFDALGDLSAADPSLAPALLVSDKLAQNVAIARHLVSEPVARAVEKRGHKKTAELLDVIRGFVEACDDSGYSDPTRDAKMQRVMVYFGYDPAQGLDFAMRFYPPATYYRGFHRITVEGILVTASHRFIMQRVLAADNLPPTFYPRIEATDVIECLFSMFPGATVLQIKRKMRRMTTLSVAELGGHGHIPNAPPVGRRGRRSSFAVHADDGETKVGGEAAPPGAAGAAAPAAAGQAAEQDMSAFRAFVPLQDDRKQIAKNGQRKFLREQLTGISARPAIGYEGIRSVAQEKVKSAIATLITGIGGADGNDDDDGDADPGAGDGVAPDADDGSDGKSGAGAGASSFGGTQREIATAWSARTRAADRDDGFTGEDSDARDAQQRNAELGRLALAVAAPKSRTGRTRRPSLAQAAREVNLALSTCESFSALRSPRR